MNSMRTFTRELRSDFGVRRRICFLLLWFWMALCAGSLYMFASWEVELMDRCHLHAEQLEGIYAAGQIGVGITLIPGIMFDKLGYRATLTFAACFIVLGTFTLNRAISSCSTEWTAVGFGLIQHGSATMFQTALFTSIATASSSEKGFSAGFVSAGYGLSAAAWSFVFGLMGRDILLFITITGIIWTCTAIVALFLFRFLFKPRKLRRHERLPDDCPTELIPQKFDAIMDVTRRSIASEEDLEIDPTLVADASLRAVLSARSFWCTLVQFVCLQCVGSGMFIANLSLLSGSWGFESAARRRIVALVSFCNAIGRISGGFAGDKVKARNFPYSCLLLVTTMLMAIGVLICMSAVSELLKVAAALLVGFAYGANWVILPADLQQRFGGKHIGITFNICTTVMSIGVFYMSRLAGTVYDEWKPDHDKDANGRQMFCHGFKCFGVPLSAALTLTVASFFVGVSSYFITSKSRIIPAPE